MEGTDGHGQHRSLAAVAAGGYWRRRGMPTRPEQVALATGAPLLLLAVLATTGGAVLMPRPSPSWHVGQARLLGRPLHTVPVPVECGGVPDPVALRETARRVRADGQVPRVLLLSVADDCTGTAAPPELLHEVCEAAGDEGLLIVSDETWRDTSYAPHGTVVVSPAEMLHGGPGADAVVVLAGLGDALLPGSPRAGIARFPDSRRGREQAAGVRAVLGTLGTGMSASLEAAVAETLTEPEPLRARRAAVARARGELAGALHLAFTAAGALCRPPLAGRHLYADLEPLRSRLIPHGIKDAAGLEAELVRRFGPYANGGHRFGDDPQALRVRVSGELLTRGSRAPSVTPESPDVRRRLAAVRTWVSGLAASGE